MSTDLERQVREQLHAEAERLAPDGSLPPLRADVRRRGARWAIPRHRWAWPALAAAAVLVVAVTTAVVVTNQRGGSTPATPPVGSASLGTGTPAPSGSPTSTRSAATRATHPATPDVSRGGRAAYACAMAVDAHDHHGPVTSWHFTVGDAGPAWIEVAGASQLLGASVGASGLYPRLSPAAAHLYEGITQLDFAAVQNALDTLTTECVRQGLPPTGLDVSRSGRISYTCALATDIRDHHGPADTWHYAVGNDAGAAWVGATAIAGLLGSWFGMDHPRGYEGFSGIGPALYSAITNLDQDAIQHAMTKLTAACAAIGPATSTTR